MDLTEGSETSEIIKQTPGNYPKESLLYSVHGESLKSGIICGRMTYVYAAAGLKNFISAVPFILSRYFV